MPRSQFQKDFEDFVNKITKDEKDKKERDNKPSFRKHLEDNGVIKNKDTAIDDDVYGSFSEYIDRKKNKDNE